MTSVTNLKVFTTHPHPCSYLEGKEATTLFIDPLASIDKSVYSRLSESGFRRSGEHLYTPHCQNCRECVPVRIPVNQFHANRAQKRILKRNNDLTVSSPPDIASKQYYQLYADYISLRHDDGDMYPPSREQYDAFLTKEWGLTHYFAFWRGEKLKAVAVVDEMDNGLSSVYTFYDPFDEKRSLGIYSILWQIQLTQAGALRDLYLGYWIKNCRKMSYKINFRPIEFFTNGQWVIMA